MGHSGGVEQSGCRVLPIIDEGSESESDSETGSSKGVATKVAAMGAIAERRRVIVARMRELLRRAVTQSSLAVPRSKLCVSTVAGSGKKWKRVVSLRSRDQRQGQPSVEDMSSAASSASSNRNSFGSCEAAVFSSPARTPLNTAQAQQQAQWITTDSDFVVLEL